MKIIKKKAILAFAMSMILSLATLQGISQKNVQQQDMNLQQISVGSAMLAAETEGAWKGFWVATATMSGAVASGLTVAAITNVWNPVGWSAACLIGGFYL